MPMMLGEITLPAGLVLTNEYAWTGVARSIEKSVTGVPVVQKTPLASGRSLVFAGESAWLSKSDLDALVALVAADGPHTLTLNDGRTVPVEFDETPFETAQVLDYEDPAPADQYQLLKLNFITTDVMTDPEA